MSNVIGTQGERVVVDYAELVVQLRPLLRRLEDQLNNRELDKATITALEMKVLSGALYYHLAAIPRVGINYAGIDKAQAPSG